VFAFQSCISVDRDREKKNYEKEKCYDEGVRERRVRYGRQRVHRNEREGDKSDAGKR
jgi:hypothetical protein